MVRGISTLGWQIKGDRQSGLPAAEVLPEEAIGGRRTGVTGVRAEDPWPISGWIALGIGKYVRGCFRITVGHEGSIRGTSRWRSLAIAQ